MRCPRCGWKIAGLTKEKVSEMRESYPKAFSPWTPKDDETLAKMAQEGKSVIEMVQALSRQPTAILKRMSVLNISIVTAGKSYLSSEGKLGEGAEPSTDEAV
jgi:hypothetical protein